MTCVECGGPIPPNKRSDSKYCSTTCAGRAKNKRAEQRLIQKATQDKPAYPAFPIGMGDTSLYGFTEIRELEKDKFATVLNLKEKYEGKIKELETSVLNQNFEIQRLKDQKEDLIKTHERELQNANTNTVKSTVQAITTMPAIQGALGALANNLIPSGNNALNGTEISMSEIEKQILDSIRKMQRDAQQCLVNMLYFLFSKDHNEQMEIFSSLMAYMQAETSNTTEENDLP